MAANTISLTFKLEELNGGFKQITADAEDFKRVMAATVTPAEELTNKLGNFASTSVVFTAMADAIQQLNSAVNDLTAAYAVQEQAETQLQTVMQQRMNATAADVQAIKELCSAQQKLGVIGDEVQLAGAQQIATFLREKSSLEVLIPAMNDLVAQQRGLNATSADAVSAANLMGKAMQGQTSALRRVGITFTEAQAEVMKFGTESEKAAMLVEIITDNFGHMNTELAKTDSGKLKQVKNDLGDVKETLGGLVQPIAPLINVVSGVTISLVAVLKLTTAVKGAIVAMWNWNAAQKAVILTAKFLVPGIKGLVVSYKMLTTAQKVAAIAATALKTALRGLLIASGIGAMVWAISAAYDALGGSADDAADSTDNLTAAQRREQAAAERSKELTKATAEAHANADLQLKGHIQTIENFKGTKEQENTLLQELNDTYGKSMGYFDSLSKWYDALIANSADYCKQMVLEAQTRKLVDQIIAARTKYKEASGNDFKGLGSTSYQNEQLKASQAKVDFYDKKIADLKKDRATDKSGNLKEFFDEQIKEAEAAKAAWERAVKKYTAFRDMARDAVELDSMLIDTRKEVMGLNFSVKGSSSRPGVSGAQTTPLSEMSIEQLEAKKSQLEDKLKKSSPGEAIADLVKEYDATTKALESRQAAVGLNKKSGGKGKGNSRPKTKKVVEGDNLSREQLATNTELYAKKLTSEDTSEQKMMREKIDSWQKMIYQIDLAEKAAQRPLKLDTLDDISREMEYQQLLRKHATEENIGGIDKEIKRLELLGRKMEISGHIAKPVGEIKTYQELNDEISIAGELLEMSYPEEREQIQKRINDLNTLKREWEDHLASIAEPKDLSELKTLDELSEARKHYTDLQQKADADEFLRLQEIINAIDKKTEALQRGTLIADNKQDLSRLSSLSGEPLRLELQAIGFEAIEEKIKSLQALLSDTANPLSDSMKEIVEGQIKQYEGFSKNKAFGGISKETKKTLGYVDEMGAAFKTIGSNIGVPALDVMGTIAQAIANLILSYSQATAESASLGPFGWMAFSMAGLATLTSIVGSVKGLSAFADGGIVSGPTLGLVGEYAGASHNPEVIAPLNKLKTLIEPRDSVIGGHVEFEIEGRKLKGVLQRVNNLSIRS